jgi:hypothetical protein
VKYAVVVSAAAAGRTPATANSIAVAANNILVMERCFSCVKALNNGDAHCSAENLKYLALYRRKKNLIAGNCGG